MVVEEIITLISTVGFPIAAYLLMWKTMNDGMAELTSAVEENTKTLQELRVQLATINKKSR
jgi:hypothetical protein